MNVLLRLLVHTFKDILPNTHTSALGYLRSTAVKLKTPSLKANSCLSAKILKRCVIESVRADSGSIHFHLNRPLRTW